MISDIPGIWLHHTADCQKYFVLQDKPSLITDGLWSLSRNPNYLGELFILGAFAGWTMDLKTTIIQLTLPALPIVGSPDTFHFPFNEKTTINTQVLPGITQCGGGPG